MITENILNKIIITLDYAVLCYIYGIKLREK
jgi:hypothetical protein